jgi:hypothetical protein
MPKMPALPLAPLEAIARVQADLPSYSSGETIGTWNDQVFAEMIGVSTRALSRWRALTDTYPGGEIPWMTADAAAIRLGYHPLAIWHDAWDSLDADVLDGKLDAEINKDLEQIGRVMAQQAAMLAVDGPTAS